MTDSDRGRMKDVSHTHPYTGETFGRVYRRGPAVADGGERGERPDGDEADDMSDVDHTPPHGDGANAVWERGNGEDDEDVEEDG